MPLSRKQQIDQHERRLIEIAKELEGITTEQTKVTTPKEQMALVQEKQDLEGEKIAIGRACEALRLEMEEDSKRKEAQALKKWNEDERPAFQQEFEEICAKIEKRLDGAKKAYDDLKEAERKAKEQWKQRGSVGSPVRILSQRNFADFLGVKSTRRVASSYGRRQNHFTKMFSEFSYKDIRG